MTEPVGQQPSLPELPLPPVARAALLPERDLDASPAAGRAASCGCSSCGCGEGGRLSTVRATAAGTPVYAVGRLRARFPSLGVEREFQARTGSDPEAVVPTADVADVLSENPQLARYMCWVLESPLGTEACVVTPRDRQDIETFIATLQDGDMVVHAIVGSPAPVDAPYACQTQTALPVVWADELLSFEVDEMLDAMPGAQEGKEAAGWRQTAKTLFSWLTQRAGNLGTSDQHRALNYLALRYPALYHLTYEQQSAGNLLIAVDTQPSVVAGRRAVAVRFVFRNPHTQMILRHQCYVDVHEVLPFLAQPLKPTYE